MIRRSITDPDNCQFERIKSKNRKGWLENRKAGLGGSDAACVLGLNPWKTSEQLWEEKVGLRAPEDISNKEAVKYGSRAERPLRELFALDFPYLDIYHSPNTVLVNKTLPWLRVSLDGELFDKDGRRGVLEVKTTLINQSMQREKWNEQVPDNYYCQILHALLVTGYEFAILKAQLKSNWPDGIRISTKHYFFEREQEADSMKHLLAEEIKFWKYVTEKQRPPLVLPQI